MIFIIAEIHLKPLKNIFKAQTYLIIQKEEKKIF
jgi:hypothetical protein